MRRENPGKTDEVSIFDRQYVIKACCLYFCNYSESSDFQDNATR